MHSNKSLKKLSRKKLYSLIGDLEIQLGTKSLELSTEEYIHEIHKTALKSAEHALVYKEKEIDHKDRLLEALTNS